MRRSTIKRPATGERRLRRLARSWAASSRLRAIAASALWEARIAAASTPESKARWWRSSSAEVSATCSRASASAASGVVAGDPGQHLALPHRGAGDEPAREARRIVQPAGDRDRHFGETRGLHHPQERERGLERLPLQRLGAHRRRRRLRGHVRRRLVAGGQREEQKRRRPSPHPPGPPLPSPSRPPGEGGNLGGGAPLPAGWECDGRGDGGEGASHHGLRQAIIHSGRRSRRRA